nr:reverse transcriptase domain-containing protein [Tanacetum cinerariifolium]
MSRERHDMIEDDAGNALLYNTESTIDDVIYQVQHPISGRRPPRTPEQEIASTNWRHPMFHQTMDGPARGWFDRFPNRCIDNWTDLREAFVERFALRRKCSKDSTKVAKIVRRANETLPDFKERWTEEMSYIPDIPVVMVDDFVKSDEVFKNTELPKGEHLERPAIAQCRGSRHPLHSYGSIPSRVDIYRRGDHYQPYVTPRAPDGRYDNQRRELEIALESEKHNYLIKDARQIGDGPLIVEAKVEGYWIRRVFLDQGASVQVMFKHCFDNLSPNIKARLAPTQTEIVGFSGEHVIPIGKIELKHIRAYMLVRAPGNFIHHSRHDEVSNTKRNRYHICSRKAGIGVPMVGKKGGGTRGDGKRNGRDKEPEHERRRKSRHGASIQVFLDAYKGYHQIQMSEEDNDKTAFYTDQGTYCYVKMSFGLKNARATYQRLIDLAFRTQLGEWKFLGYMVTSEGIRANPKKTKAIVDMKSPKTLKEMQSLSGKLSALNRFLSRSAERSLPFFETLKNITKENKEDYRWTEEAEHAFQKLKKFVLELPTLTTPDLKETLFVYLATSHDTVSGILVADQKGKQTPIRYVSWTLHEAEQNYAPLDKLALCLLHLSRRLRRYFEAHPVKVIRDQPIKQILNKPEVSGKLAKYAVELGVYNITYIPRTAVKGQILDDFINEIPAGTQHVEACNSVGEEDPKGWTLYTDEASSQKGVGAGLVLIDPSGTEYTYAIQLNFPSTNNEAKYKALLAGLRIARNMKVQTLDVQVDSKLVACQMNGEFIASNEGMDKYMAKAKEQAILFKKFSTKNIPKNQNQKADVLSKLDLVAFNHLTKEILVELSNTKSVDVQGVSTIVKEEEDNWMTPIIKCLEEGVWPTDENEARTLQMKIGQYVVEDRVLFKKSYLSPMLRCVGLLQANYIIREVHEGACEMHAGARFVVAKITRQGYYWPTMHEDTKEVVDKFSGILVADQKGKQTPIRYVSWTLHEAEQNYAPLDKLALCLLHLSRRLRRYFEAHPVKVIRDQPIKQILNKPEVSGKLAKYAVELGVYNITYIPRTAVKGQILDDFINEIPAGTQHVEACNSVGEEDPKGWTLYTDEASSQKGVGAGLVLIDPSGTEYTYAIQLNFPSTNNEAKYKALLAGLRIARNMKVQTLDVQVDSKLVACQMNGEFIASNEGMDKYMAKAKEQAILFKKFSTKNIPKNQNQKADVLSKLDLVAFNHLTKEILVELSNTKSVDVQGVSTIVKEEEDNWMTPIIKCLEEGVRQTRMKPEPFK